MRPTFLLLALLLTSLFPAAALAADPPPPSPLEQPRSQSPYGMDILGPAWQWTFPREDGWPRLSTSIRVDQLDEILQKSWGAGVRSVRFAIWWCLTEPKRDQYSWEDIDYAFQIANNYGLIPVPEIYYTPDWAAVGYDTGQECVNLDNVRNLPPMDMSDWSDLMEDFVSRYGIFGKNQVHDWEIWNEPDLFQLLYVPYDPENANVTVYADLVKRAREQIDAHDPGGRLLLGGLSDIYGPRFLERLLALRGPLDIRQDADIVTFHIFSDHIAKLNRLTGALGDEPYELWLTEYNSFGWPENISASSLGELFQYAWDQDITRVFWFKSWTTDWGPGIFSNRDPLWVPGPFVTNDFYNTYKNQAFPHNLPSAPAAEWPPAEALTPSQPFFAWQRPDAGSFLIVGYKLQVDDSLYQGQPYFHTPEIDAWVPATYLHFFPVQIASPSASITRIGPAPKPAAVVPAIESVTYQATLPLATGRYFWRVAAVDSEGNVGPYTSPLILIATPGSERVFLPALSYELTAPPTPTTRQTRR